MPIKALTTMIKTTYFTNGLVISLILFIVDLMNSSMIFSADLFFMFYVYIVNLYVFF